MSARPLDILLIEDDHDYATLIQRLAHQNETFSANIIHHDRLESGLSYLREDGTADIVLLDLNLPDSSDPLNTFNRVRAQDELIAIIILTGVEEIDLSKQLVQSGAQDYLGKAHISTQTLSAAIIHARERHDKVLALRKTATEATAAEQRLSKMINASTDGMLVLDLDGRIRFTNPAMRVMLGRDGPDSLIGMEFGYPIGSEAPTEIDILRPDGSHALAEMRIVPIDWENSAGYLATFRDVTERQQTAEALRRTNERFKTVIYSSPDTHLGITYPGRELTLYREEFLGYTRSQIEDDDALFDATHPDDRTLMRQHQSDIAASAPGEVVTAEYRMYSKVGKLEWVQARGMVSDRASDGSTREILLNLSIVTVRKQADQRLQESEKRFRLLADDAPVMIWMTGLDPREDYFNHAWTNLTGRSVEDERGGGWLHNVHPDDHDDVRAAYAGAMRNQSLFDAEFRLRRADGDYAWVLSHGVPRRTAEGEFTGFIGSTVDITQRKTSEAEAFEIAVQRRQIEITQQFIEAATHEFRTPLSIINSNVYLTQRVKDASRQRRYLEEIHGQVESISLLIDDLVTMLQLDGLHDLTVESVHVNELVGTALIRCEARIAAKPLALTKTLDDGLPRIEGNRPFLGMAVYRLLDNAIRYTLPDGVLAVRTFAYSDGYVGVEVTDTGIGMEAEEVARAFDAFYRKDSAHSTRGFGLGLSIAQRAITLHNGRIEVTSTPGEGSTFTVILPTNTASGTTEG